MTVAGRPVKLTATEYEVLRVLFEERGARLDLSLAAPPSVEQVSRTRFDPKLVHAVVQTLRRKLGEDGSRAAWILNERGLGYRMPAPVSAGGP